MIVTRARRDATARALRLLVVALSFGAATALALVVRSCDDDIESRSAPLSRTAPPAPSATAPSATAREAEEPVDVSVPRADAAAPDAASGAADPVGTEDPATGAMSVAGALPSLDDLRSRFLTIPVEGVQADQLVAGFANPRGNASHEALDILSPKGTPVVAVESGRIVKLFVSERGGLTAYQFDTKERFTYYYAHLDRYADGLTEGQTVRRGQIIGYVGTSGNAPKDTPHLHFAIFELGPEKHWWEGTPIDPYLVWRRPDDASD